MAKAKPAQSKTPAVIDLQAAETPPQSATVVDSASDSFSDLGPKRSYRWVGWLVAVVVIVGGLFGGFHLVYASKIYPGVSVDGVYLGGVSKSQAQTTLTQSLGNYQQGQIPVQYANTSVAVDLSQVQLTYDIPTAVNEAYSHGRNGSVASRVWQIARGLVSRSTPIAQYNFNADQLTSYISKIADAVDTPVTNASLSISDTGRVQIAADQAGQRLDIGQLTAAIEQHIATSSSDSIAAPVYSLAPSVSQSQLTALKAQADAYLSGPLTLNFSGITKSTTVQVKDMVGWLDVTQAPVSLPSPNLTLSSLAYSLGTPPVNLTLDSSAISSYVSNIASSTDQAGQNAALTMQNGQVTIFQPSKTGYTLDQAAAVGAIEASMTKPAAERTVALTVKVTQPAVTAANLNNLGINDLLSEGVTNFPGSPSDRLTNIRVGAAAMNDVLVAPGQTFSAGATLGDIDAAHGYVPAIVIEANKEELQYGGGLCQVTSTAFRAALLAGLPIVERYPHSYAVSYYTAPYGVPGTDAAINYPDEDFKFKNDTSAYILIQTSMVGTTLKFDFYGTKTKTGRINAPYFVNPAGGAGWNPTVPSDTIFTRDVLDLNGNVISTDTFKSHYQSSLDFPLTTQIN